MKVNTKKILQKTLNYVGIFIAIFLITVLISDVALARPGGGHGFSGGGGSGGGGGGGDGLGYLIYLLISELPPQISIPLIIAIIVLYQIYLRKQKNKNTAVTSTPNTVTKSRHYNNVDVQLKSVKSIDPNFSKVLFLDFVSLIYNKYYSTFGTKEFNNLSAFFLEHEIKESQNYKDNKTVSEIVIGSMNISDIQILQNVIGIAVDINANYTVNFGNKKSRMQVIERWYFNRNKTVQSVTPEKLQRLSCPSCGASANFNDAGTCSNCGNYVKTGEMQWFVKTHKLISQESFRTRGLAHYEQEAGTNLPTIYQNNLNENIGIFAGKHSNLDFYVWQEEFVNSTVKKSFLKIYDAWSKNNLMSVRGLISDRLYESFMFWINAYKQEGLTNKLENIKISEVQIAKFEFDKYYESVTLRIFASALDYVVDSSGKVKGGSSRRERKFSEYWTFIRKAGVEKDSYDFSTCPSCGAPANNIGKGGECEYCGNKITNGDFSWVLSIITQDEVYYG